MTTKKLRPPQTKSKPNPPAKLLIREHLQELVARFYWWLASFILGSVLGYLNSPDLLDWLIRPLHQPLFYTSPIGGFEAVFGLSAMFGLVLSIPVLVYQIIQFIQPTLPRFHGHKLFAYLLVSALLALAGLLTAYYLVFPASLNFLSQFGGSELQALISTRDYFNFIGRYLLGFAILFQFPLVMYLLSLVVPLTPSILLQKFKYVLVASFLVAAVLTPTPDLVNQTIMALPLILLYLLTTLILMLKKVTV